ncbi:hypothetical protein CcaverHIS002_0308560 [Cutaneotrichosporon cavernicola]|uniref:Uncharacterized protein n=1 Tax=Cutaneotrichosporon cavernicola TaxID=279322 RepID=A0AA48L2F5_9TREE|nr:uncharacterized protein CcaverHIS019_0308420 [Cutaneotrichosporon cavernicola]BEI82988.1 hypothetical protein CcaverHIS002_0308560 [Cutaneotrichosporon cavernicola]BEI90772.1 hypothetical protein CcaverHIS019_0308420 [Cutaneotrichosporon cavernicola]
MTSGTSASSGSTGVHRAPASHGMAMTTPTRRAVPGSGTSPTMGFCIVTGVSVDGSRTRGGSRERRGIMSRNVSRSSAVTVDNWGISTGGGVLVAEWGSGSGSGTDTIAMGCR